MIIDFGNKGGGGSAKLEEKNFTITQNGDTPIVPSEGFDGIFQGTITTNVQPKLQAKTIEITGNGLTDITADEGNYGLSKVTVNTQVTSTGSQIDITGTGWETEPVFPVDLSRTASLNDDIEYTRTKFAEWDPNEIDLYGKYQNDTNLVYAPKIDTSKVTNMSYMFFSCSSLTTVPQFDTTNVTDMSHMFFRCSNLTSVPQIDTTNVTDMNLMFTKCTNFTSVPFFNTSNVTTMIGTFKECENLISFPQIDASKITNLDEIFRSCLRLKNIGGFLNLKVSLDLTDYGDSYPLTHQSLINIINNLGTADPSFEAQPKLRIGSRNLAKLTPEEIAVGTAKGWQIVA